MTTDAAQSDLLPCPMYADERLPIIAAHLRRLASLIDFKHVAEKSTSLGDANYLDDLAAALTGRATPSPTWREALETIAKLSVAGWDDVSSRNSLADLLDEIRDVSRAALKQGVAEDGRQPEKSDEA